MLAKKYIKKSGVDREKSTGDFVKESGGKGTETLRRSLRAATKRCKFVIGVTKL